MDEIYAVMLSWAVTLSGYQAPDSLPHVALVKHAELVKEACGGRECRILGWFPPGNTIFLDERLDPRDDLFASSIVVHEMVHYLQQESGHYGEYSCEHAIEREREAYAVQRAYLTRYGVFLQVGASMHGATCKDSRPNGLAGNVENLPAR